MPVNEVLLAAGLNYLLPLIIKLILNKEKDANKPSDKKHDDIKNIVSAIIEAEGLSTIDIDVDELIRDVVWLMNKHKFFAKKGG